MSRILVGYLFLIILVLFLASMITAKSHQTASTKPQRVITIYPAQSSKVGNQSAYIIGEAANPQKFLSAFYQAKGRLYLSSKHGIFAERTVNGEMLPVKRIAHGLVFREAGQEIGNAIGEKLPIQTQSVVLGWPKALWDKLEASVAGSDMAIITYTVDQKNKIQARRKQ